jgi:hypothetical protein
MPPPISSRAARYTLAHLPDDPFASRVLEALRLDPIGSMSAAAARAMTRTLGGSARISLLAPHLVNTSLPRGAASVLVHVAIGARTRLARRFR